jgi:hypothetical protein
MARKSMSDVDFKAELRQAGIGKQVKLVQVVERLTGHKMDPTTSSRWTRGVRGVNPLALAFIRLFKRLPDEQKAELLADEQKPAE